MSRAGWRWRSSSALRPPEVAGYDRFVLVGEGGSGQVWRARQRSVDRVVAIKVIDADLDDVAQRDFVREQRITASLDGHPNIIRVFDAGRTEPAGDDPGRPYLAMELLPDGSYADRVRRRGPLPWVEAIADAAKVADALALAHSRGIVHRDVKPQNLLVSPWAGPVLADFGIAVLDQHDAPAEAFSVLHTAPEVLAGEPATPSADLYSLASTLYELLAGRAPHHDPDDPGLVAVLGRIERGRIPPLDRPDIDADTETELLGFLATDPARRPPDAEALAERLRSLLPGVPPGAVSTVGPAEPPLRVVGRGIGGGDHDATVPPPDLPSMRSSSASDAIPAPTRPVHPDLTRTMSRHPPQRPVLAADPAPRRSRRRLVRRVVAALAVTLLVGAGVLWWPSGEAEEQLAAPPPSLDDPAPPCPAETFGTGRPGSAADPVPPSDVRLVAGEPGELVVRFVDRNDGAASHAVLLACVADGGERALVAVSVLAPGVSEVAVRDPRGAPGQSVCVTVGVIEPGGGTSLPTGGDETFACGRP